MLTAPKKAWMKSCGSVLTTKQMSWSFTQSAVAGGPNTSSSMDIEFGMSIGTGIFYLKRPYVVEVDKFPLPSDSRFRHDLLYLNLDQIEKSQDEKEKMEED